MMIKSIIPLWLCAMVALTSVSALGGNNCFNILKKRRRQIKKHLLDADTSEIELTSERKKITPESSNMKASSRNKNQAGRRRGSKTIAAKKNTGNHDLGWISYASMKDELGWIAQVSSL